MPTTEVQIALDEDDSLAVRERPLPDVEKPSSRYDDDIKNLNEVPFDLTVWNSAAFTFQFISAVPLFWLASDSNQTWYMYSHYPVEFKNPDEEMFGIPMQKRVATFSLTWYSAVFILMSGIYHLSVTLPCVSGHYEYYIARHQNPFRWFEYTFSASLMRIMIAQLTGITDIQTIFCIFVMSMTVMVLGGVHESVNAKARADGFKQNWAPYYASWLPQIGSWIVILWYFGKVVGSGNGSPTLWTTVFIQFTLDASFAAVFHLQWAKYWIFEDYIVGEKSFIVLSFVSKSILAWVNIGVGGR